MVKLGTLLLIGTVGSHHYWLRLGLLSLGLYGLWSLVTSIISWVKRSKTTIAKNTGPDHVDELMTMILPWKNPEMRKGIKSGSRYLVLAIVVFFIGTLIGENHERRVMIEALNDSTKRFTYTHVQVQERLDDKRFRVQPARMASMNIVTCSTVDWQPGDQLKDWTFEQMPGCKRVVSYHYD